MAQPRKAAMDVRCEMLCCMRSVASHAGTRRRMEGRPCISDTLVWGVEQTGGGGGRRMEGRPCISNTLVSGVGVCAVGT